MSAIFHFHEGPDLPVLSLAAGLADPSQLAPETDRPDARLFLLSSPGGTVTACAALWWRDTPVYEGARLGTIGGFAAVDETSARVILEEACVQLKAAACSRTVGPMNGNTWRSHRYVTGGDGSAPFLLEPRNAPELPSWWSAAGFSELSRYSSSRMDLSASADPFPDSLRGRLERSGVVIRPLDPDHFEEDLKAIYEISLKSFASNFLYTPLDEASFLGAYRKVRDRIDPDFVRLALRDGQPCGFVFAIPDLEAAARGEKPAIIVKTLAVDPGARCAGLGSLLVAQVHELAKAKGFTHAIHALQYESNTSLKITGRHHGQVIRRYALFSKLL